MLSNIRLRSLLLDGNEGFYASGDPIEQEAWRKALREWLPCALKNDGRSCILVVEAPGTPGLAACGIGMRDERPPAPGILNGRCGWVQSIVTCEKHRGQGYAYAIVQRLLDWFLENDVSRIMLNSTP